jgi:PAS domain S-box-containing protein
MKIKTQLLSSVIILAVILMIGSVTVIVGNQRLQEIAKQEDLARSIQQDTNELGFLTNSYLLFRDRLQLTLWQSKIVAISDGLAALEASDQQQQNLIDDMKLNQQRLLSVFTDIKTNINNNPAASQNLDYIGTAFSRLSVQNQGILASSNQLSQLLQTQSNRIKHNNNQLIFILFVVFGILILANFLLINRRIMRGLSSLEAGAKVIGSGKLDHVVLIKSKDEIGEVSSAFNQMASDLKTVTASKSELEKEIKERKKAEEELLQRENRFRILIENLRSGVALIDEQGQFITVNSTFLRMFGLSKESTILNVNSQNWNGWQVFEADGKTLLDVDDHPVRKAGLTGQAVRNRLVGMRLPSGGDLIWLIINAEPILKSDGTIQYVIATYYDISERKLAEEELNLREKEYRSLAENIPDIVTRYDRDLRYIFANEAASQAAGIPAVAFIGKTKLELGQDPDQSAYWTKLVKKVFASGKPGTTDVQWMGPNGLQFLHTIITPEFDVDGSVKTVLCVSHDLTEIKRTEEALQHYTRELETYRNHLEDLVNQRTRELQSLSYRLINAQEDEKRKVSRELHDQTGQSLTVLNLLMAKALRSPETALSDIKEAQQTVKEVLSQVRNLSASLHPGMLEDLGLLPTLQWYLNDFAKKTGININLAHSGLERSLTGDINITVYRIIQEALTNITRYAEVKEAGVSLKLENQILSIRIEDKGKGFAVESQQQGVGLRGMKERVNALEGNLKIHSAPGEGTLIEVELPVPLG